MQIAKSKLSPLKAWKYVGKTPVTLSVQDVFIEPRRASDRYRGFHINDQDKCIGCGTCSEICPTEAITLVEVEGRESSSCNIGIARSNMLPTFDYGRCSFCGLCVDICASDSLGMTKEYIHVSEDLDSFVFMPDLNGIHGVHMEDGYRRDASSDLLDLERYEMDELPMDEMGDSFVELVRGYSKEMALSEASRCVECGLCSDVCPANMNVPEYVRAVFEDRLEDGLEILYKTNPLPDICGRVCTHKCETACSLSHRGEPVAIRWLKRFIVDNVEDSAYERKILSQSKKMKETVKRVAIVGSGPAGLSAAYYLSSFGYNVTVFEQKPLAGGVLRYGIPEYRLPDRAVNKDIQVIRDMGVEIKTNMKIGMHLSMHDLREGFDAVFLATGLWMPKVLKLKNNDHSDVIYSNDFLESCREYTAGLRGTPEVHEKVIVIGGGDVSFDVARSLVRLQKEKYGVSHVSFVARKDEMHLAASLEEVVEARIENVKYNFSACPLEILVERKNGHIKGLKVAETVTKVNDDGHVQTIVHKNKTRIIDGTQVYFAVGSAPDYAYLKTYFGEAIEFDHGKLAILETGQVKGQPWLFAGGDIVRGPDIVSAVADGQRAAKGIDDYLRFKSSTFWISPML